MSVERRLAWLVSSDGLPARERLPRYVAPLPDWLENVGLNLAWLVVAVNLAGTAFGFWYYGFHPIPLSDPLITWQFAMEPVVMWPFVPDSPMATLFIALSLAAWKLGRSNEYLNALAFFGCIKLGFWTPITLLAFAADFSYLHWAMYNFLFWSHLAMVLEAFLIYRYGDLPPIAVGVALFWYGLNDVVDYFIPVVGGAHHTIIPAEPVVDGVIAHDAGREILLGAGPHAVAAAAAVVLTLAATYLALSTHIEKLKSRPDRAQP